MAHPYVLLPAGALTGHLPGEFVELPAATRRHLTTVLRLSDGAPVTAADGAGLEAAAEVAPPQALRLSTAPVAVARYTPRVTVWQALGKSRKHDEVVRVLTELDVDRIVAVTTDHTVGVRDGAGKASARWQAVATAACEQARRPWLPQLDGPVALADLVVRLGGRPCLVAHVGAETDLLTACVGLGAVEDVVVAVGPEGGWSTGELAAFSHAGATTVGLGATVLRTEHAAATAAAVVLAATGRMGGHPPRLAPRRYPDAVERPPDMMTDGL